MWRSVWLSSSDFEYWNGRNAYTYLQINTVYVHTRESLLVRKAKYTVPTTAKDGIEKLTFAFPF